MGMAGRDAGKKLCILSEPNRRQPLTRGMKPILTIDVWEHAYYIDYRNRRAAYIEAFWELIDWTKLLHASKTTSKIETLIYADSCGLILSWKIHTNRRFSTIFCFSASFFIFY